MLIALHPTDTPTTILKDAIIVTDYEYQYHVVLTDDNKTLRIAKIKFDNMTVPRIAWYTLHQLDNPQAIKAVYMCDGFLYTIMHLISRPSNITIVVTHPESSKSHFIGCGTF